jgi:hypothetical protein
MGTTAKNGHAIDARRAGFRRVAPTAPVRNICLSSDWGIFCRRKK